MAYEKDGKLYDERTHELIKDQHPGVPDSPYVGKHSLNSEEDDERDQGLRGSVHQSEPVVDPEPNIEEHGEADEKEMAAAEEAEARAEDEGQAQAQAEAEGEAAAAEAEANIDSDSNDN